ncbi:hypothetical protein [Providencia sp. JUb39]|uniref:hypothetical protein n=1 Tax=Providencia sp. JUb39 TaxID=2724165 RepID=UPI00164D2138|nr:hypothetical protein [Providencia sp. JUb39]MBC5791245.1 hypothetical protein [Providencia sp. JUb39]
MDFQKICNNTDIIENLNLSFSKDFDKNSMLRIIELYKLRDLVMGYLEEQESIIPPPKDDKIYRQHSIYTSLLHSIDLLIYNFVNDESLVVLHREPVKLTMGVCTKGLFKEGYSFPRQDRGLKEIQNLYVNRNDEMIGSMFLDFSTAIFSAFEMFISDVYYLKESKEKIANSENYYHKNIPAKNKIDSVLKLCQKTEKPISKEDKIKFLECINVLREMRNTIHTLGYYTKDNDITYSINEMTVFLKKSHPVTTSDHRFHFLICRDILEIYRKICNILNVEQIKYIDFSKKHI